MSGRKTIRALAETAEGAWGTDWYSDIAPWKSSQLYGVIDREIGTVGEGMCEEVAEYVAAVNPAVVLRLLNEVDRLRARLRWAWAELGDLERAAYWKLDEVRPGVCIVCGATGPVGWAHTCRLCFEQPTAAERAELEAAMTPREEADACCDECRALEGEGPWCMACGREMPGAVTNGTRFTDEACEGCPVVAEALSGDLVAAVDDAIREDGTA